MTQALGRGLSALLEDSAAQNNENTEVAQAPAEQPAGTAQNSQEGQPSSSQNYQPQSLALTVLQAGQYQPRHQFGDEAIEELAQSIKEQGVLQPILVRPVGEDRYEIIAGERRFRAAGLAGLADIPVIIRADINDTQALEIALIENIQRQNLTPIEEAEGYRRLQVEFNYTQEKLAEILGKSRSHVTNSLRLLSLPERIKTYINDGKLSMGHGRALVGVDDAEALADAIIKESLSVRDVEQRLKQHKAENDPYREPAAFSPPKEKAAVTKEPYVQSSVGSDKDEDLIELERALSGGLGLKVQIDETDAGGTVTLHFGNLMELDKILQKLGDE
jgi:ParB family chromosome partitioning protein